MVEENRYTRLKSISDFGYDVNWEDLQLKKVLIIGVGGVGSIIAEMLSRCGIGELYLIDLDVVEEVNLNRLFFKDDHIGKTKVDAAKQILSMVNSDVVVHPFMQDVCASDFEEKFEEILKECDLVVSSLDNIPARLYINQKCVELNKTYVDTGATRSGLGGYVHLVIPFKTACYSCTGSIDMGKKEEGLSCTASLPSTIAIVASIATEICLKHLLEFGTIPDYIGFNALNDQYILQKMAKDPNCFVCGEKEFTKEEKEKSIAELDSLTKGKSLSELMGDLDDKKEE